MQCKYEVILRSDALRNLLTLKEKSVKFRNSRENKMPNDFLWRGFTTEKIIPRIYTFYTPYGKYLYRGIL